MLFRSLHLAEESVEGDVMRGVILSTLVVGLVVLVAIPGGAYLARLIYRVTAAAREGWSDSGR